MISSLELIKRFENGSSLKSADSLKTVFWSFWCISGIWLWAKVTFLSFQTIRVIDFQKKSEIKSGKASLYVYTIFPKLMTTKCIGTSRCLRYQEGHLQMTWNFFSVKKGYSLIGLFLKNHGAKGTLMTTQPTNQRDRNRQKWNL